MKKYASIAALALAIFVAAPAVFARGVGGPSHGSGGTARPECWIAGKNAMQAIDLRNNGRTRDEARSALYISAMGQPGNTPEWIVRDIIDPRLHAAYKTPASEKIDPNAVGEAVFRECQARLMQVGAR